MEHAIEALDAGVLDCIVDHVPRVQSHRQRHESPAGEPRPLIGADGQVLASEVRARSSKCTTYSSPISCQCHDGCLSRAKARPGTLGLASLAAPIGSPACTGATPACSSPAVPPRSTVLGCAVSQSVSAQRQFDDARAQLGRAIVRAARILAVRSGLSA